jgi:prolyl oligopeptidase
MKVFYVCLIALLFSMNLDAQPQPPYTRKDDAVTDNYFGTEIKDPYRWLEDDTSAETADWVNKQIAYTNSYLRSLPLTEKIKTDLTKLWNYPKMGVPFKEGNYYYFYKNDGLQNQSVLYRQQGTSGKPEVFLDPNSFSKDGTSALGSIEFSKNGKYAVYSVSKAGSDWQDLFVLDVATKKLIADKIEFTKFGGATWIGDEGFYYSGYDRPTDEAKKFSNVSEFQKVFYHKIGSAQSADELVYEDKAHPLLYKSVGITEDQRFLILYLSEGTDGTELMYKDLQNAQQKIFLPLVSGFQYNHAVVDNIDGKLLVHTNLKAPNYRLVLINPAEPQPENWKTIVAEAPEKLDVVQTVGGKLICSYLKDACTQIKIFNYNGKEQGSFVSPGLGTISGFAGKKNDNETFYSYTSFNTPATIYKYDVAQNTSTVFTKPAFDLGREIVIEQAMFPSKDGTMVPMFICHRADVALEGSGRPVLMYGYGGFNISLTPSFSVPMLYWMQQGGIYVMVNLRGGSEYGENWHSAGMLDKKQNVFDDFIAGAEYLIQRNITNPRKIAISGRSNGGLLVGACMTQRPDLFKVALPGVGVLDMLRYHKFTVGWGWAVEYGSSEKKDQFDYLIKYSPLHNLKKGTNYPATLITTADHDDRVVPAHSFKFAATLQAAHQGPNPVLIRIDKQAGHGAGKPTSKQIEEWADVLSFTMQNLGMRPIPPFRH